MIDRTSRESPTGGIIHHALHSNRPSTTQSTMALDCGHCCARRETHFIVSHICHVKPLFLVDLDSCHHRSGLAITAHMQTVTGELADMQTRRLDKSQTRQLPGVQREVEEREQNRDRGQQKEAGSVGGNFTCIVFIFLPTDVFLYMY